MKRSLMIIAGAAAMVFLSGCAINEMMESEGECSGDPRSGNHFYRYTADRCQGFFGGDSHAERGAHYNYAHQAHEHAGHEESLNEGSGARHHHHDMGFHNELDGDDEDYRSWHAH